MKSEDEQIELKLLWITHALSDNEKAALEDCVKSLLREARLEVAINALAIAGYWIEEDGRPKHLIQDLWEVQDITPLDHIDEKYIARAKAQLTQEQSNG